MREKDTFDIAIIGSGISGSILAAILARAGVSVALIDRGTHPRFAIGESMIPATSYLLRIMADRYGIPELDNCSTFFKQRKYVTSSSGIKRNFSFAHHEKRNPFDPKHSTMLPVPNYPHGPESHLMRQDIDAYLFAAAIKYGAVPYQNCTINDIHIGDTGATLNINNNDSIDCAYVVDGSGHNSLISQKFDLREEPSSLETHTRSIFTHMIGVKSFDDLYSETQHELPQKLSQGTLHHIFDGGWLWVIPFNNYHSSTNQLCSVGLQLDPRKYPVNGPAEQEFNNFLNDYPEIAAQFEDAKAVRPWVSTGRLQYSPKSVVGERYCLLAHAAGFVDPLFSRGLHITMETINALAHRLIKAKSSGDYSKNNFQHVETLALGLLKSHDRLVNGSMIAFKSFNLWNAWYRCWALGGTYTSLRFRSAHIHYKMTGDRQYLDALEYHEFLGTPCPDIMEYQDLFLEAYSIMRKFDSNEIDEATAIEKLYSLYDQEWIPPIYEMTNPEKRYISPGCIDSFLESSRWGFLESPDYIRENYFNFPPELLASAVEKAMQAEADWTELLQSDFKYFSFEATRTSDTEMTQKIRDRLHQVRNLYT